MTKNEVKESCDILKKHEIVRVIDEHLFFININAASNLQEGQYVEVLNPFKSYKTLARIDEVYEKYAICQKLGKYKVFYGDEVRIRPNYQPNV
ncbi:hypothetical protein [Staphylococcus intermedius]|uniref:hypothetical protein n=1 Tax=Staphylococcus intermedius TaxID=1285 RepID=UPI000BBCB45A|nr:hypothetical protein [Staphylococcus intermedius]PCF87806.1 hypothetical protein B4W76_05290 [Staphylococcus intermedius]